MKNFILGSIIAFLFSICIYLYIQNTSLSGVIVTYKDNKEFIDKDFQKSKEAYFIQQQSDNVSLILFTVTILFTIFATVTFISVKSEFHSAIKKNDKRYDSYKAEYDNSVIHINNLRSNFNFLWAQKINDDFEPNEIAKVLGEFENSEASKEEKAKLMLEHEIQNQKSKIAWRAVRRNVMFIQ